MDKNFSLKDQNISLMRNTEFQIVKKKKDYKLYSPIPIRKTSYLYDFSSEIIKSQSIDDKKMIEHNVTPFTTIELSKNNM